MGQVELTALIVKPGAFPEVETFGSMAQIHKRLGIKGDIWETALINDGAEPFEKIGIIAHEQETSKNRRENILDMRGAFAIIGMSRSENGKLTTFTALDPEQIGILTRLLNRAVALYFMSGGRARG